MTSREEPEINGRKKALEELRSHPKAGVRRVGLLPGLRLGSNWGKPLQYKNHLGEVTGQKRGEADSVGALQRSGDGREDGRQLGLGVREPGGHEAAGPDLGMYQDAVHGDLKLAGRGLCGSACSEIMGGMESRIGTDVRQVDKGTGIRHG